MFSWERTPSLTCRKRATTQQQRKTCSYKWYEVNGVHQEEERGEHGGMEDAEFEKEGGKFKGGEEGEEEQFLSHIKHQDFSPVDRALRLFQVPFLSCLCQNDSPE